MVSASAALALLHYFDANPRMRESRERLKEAFDKLFTQLGKRLPEGSPTTAKIRNKYDTLINQEPENLRLVPITIFTAVMIPSLIAGAIDSVADLWAYLAVYGRVPVLDPRQVPWASLRGVGHWISFVANVTLPPAAIVGGFQVWRRSQRSKKYSNDVEQLISEADTALDVAREKDNG